MFKILCALGTTENQFHANPKERDSLPSSSLDLTTYE